MSCRDISDRHSGTMPLPAHAKKTCRSCTGPTGRPTRSILPSRRMAGLPKEPRWHMARTLPQRSMGAATSRSPRSHSASNVSSATHASCVRLASTARAMRRMPVFCFVLGLETPAIGLRLSFTCATLNLLSGSIALSRAAIHRGSLASRASPTCMPSPPAASAEPTRSPEAPHACSRRAASTAARFACLFFVFPILGARVSARVSGERPWTTERCPSSVLGMSRRKQSQ